MDWRVDAGKRRTRERIVHGNEKDLGAHGGTGLLFTRIYGFTMRRVRNGLFTVLSYYCAVLLRRRDKTSKEFSFSAREFFIISPVRRFPKMLEV